MIIPPTWLAAGGLALAVVGFGAGFRVRSWQCAATIAKIERAAEKQRAKQQATVNRKATDYEQEKSDVIDRGPIIRTIYKDRVVPAECEPDPRAISVLRQARIDANARIAGEPEG